MVYGKKVIRVISTANKLIRIQGALKESMIIITFVLNSRLSDCWFVSV